MNILPAKFCLYTPSELPAEILDLILSLKEKGWVTCHVFGASLLPAAAFSMINSGSLYI